MSEVKDIYSMLQEDEGLRLKVYKDTLGYWTVGIGHLLSKKPDVYTAISVLDSLVGRKTNGTITEAEARIIFDKDVNEVTEAVYSSTILSPIYTKLDSVRRQAMLNMIFQMGKQGVEAFKNSLTLVANGQYSTAAVNLRKSKWYSQTKDRAERVIQVFLTGTFDSYNK